MRWLNHPVHKSADERSSYKSENNKNSKGHLVVLLADDLAVGVRVVGAGDGLAADAALLAIFLQVQQQGGN